MLEKVVKTLMIAAIGGVIGYAIGNKKGRLDGYNEAIDDAAKMAEDDWKEMDKMKDAEEEDEFVPGEEPEHLKEADKKKDAGKTTNYQSYYQSYDEEGNESEEEDEFDVQEQEMAEEWFASFEGHAPEILTPAMRNEIPDACWNLITKHHWYYYIENWLFVDADEERVLEDEEVDSCIGEALEVNGVTFLEDDMNEDRVINYKLQTIYHIEKKYGVCPYGY